MTWIDVVLLLILAQAALAGYRQGFFSIMASLVGLVAGVLAAVHYYRLVAEMLDHKFSAAYYLHYLFLSRIKWDHPAAGAAADSFPSAYLPGVIQELPLPEYFRQWLSQSLWAVPAAARDPDTVGGVLSLILSQTLLYILVFLGIVLFVVIATRLVVGLVRLYTGEGTLGCLDRAVGMTINTALRGLVLSLLCALLVPVLSLISGPSPPGESGLLAAVKGSLVMPKLTLIFSYLWGLATSRGVAI